MRGLRFSAGDRVVCKTDDGWKNGTVVAIDYQGYGCNDADCDTDDELEFPYQVELEETATLIYVPEDTEAYCRALAPAWWVNLFGNRVGPPDKTAFDWPGEYLVVAATWIKDAADKSTARQSIDLFVPAVVNIVEIKIVGERVRGRVEKPSGWMSLRSTDHEKIWAVPVESAHAWLFRRFNPSVFEDFEDPSLLTAREPSVEDLDYCRGNSNVDELDAHGRRALMVALERDWLRVGKALLDARADPNLPNARGKRPLHLASSLGHVNAVRALVSARGDPNLKNAISFLVPGHSKTTWKGDDGHRTPLHYSTEAGNVAVTTALLESRADANALDSMGNSALHIAVKERHDSVVEALLRHDADVNIRNRITGVSSLSACSQDSTLAALLISHRACLESQDENGMTALDMVVRSQESDNARVPIEAGAHPNLREPNGCGHFECVPGSANSLGLTAAKLAPEDGTVENAQHLVMTVEAGTSVPVPQH